MNTIFGTVSVELTSISSASPKAGRMGSNGHYYVVVCAWQTADTL